MNSDRSHYRVFSSLRFRHAPVCKLWCCGVLLGSTALLPFRNLQYFVSFPTSFQPQQICKLLTSQLYFGHIPSIILGVLLIYHSRHVERLFGSYKFANFLVLSLIGVKIIELLIVEGLKSIDYAPYFMVAGPYGLLGSCVVQYLCSTPNVQITKLFGIIPLSMTILPLVLSFQLSAWSFESCVSLASGCLFGYLYNKCSLMQNISCIPKSIANIISRIMSPLTNLFEDKCGMNLPLGATKEGQRLELIERFERSLMQTQMSQAFRQQELAGGPVENRLPFLDRVFNRNNIVVSDSNITALMDMGFDNREAVKQALIDARDDINDAASILLTQHR